MWGSAPRCKRRLTPLGWKRTKGPPQRTALPHVAGIL
jgi:hypothetical protein